MNILHVTGAYPPATAYGGPLVSVSSLCEALATLGHHVKVLTTNADGDRQTHVDTRSETTLNGVDVRYTRTRFRHPLSLGQLRRLPEYVDWADVVHLTGVYSFLAPPTLLVARSRRRPIFWSPRGSLQRWEQRSYPRAKDAFEATCEKLAPRNTTLHATSEREAQDCRAVMPSLSVCVVPNGVAIPDEPIRKEESSELKLAFVGRLHPIKALDRLFAAAASLTDVSWRIELIGFGDPDHVDALKRQAKDSNILERVTFHGDLRGAAKNAVLDTASALILPSHSENFGLVVAEALARGLPVIASRGTPWQRLEEQGCGYWVENTKEALADAIRRIAAAPRAEMGRRGRQWMLEEFAWTKLAKTMASAYKDSIARSTL